MFGIGGLAARGTSRMQRRADTLTVTVRSRRNIAMISRDSCCSGAGLSTGRSMYRQGIQPNCQATRIFSGFQMFGVNPA